MRIIDKNKDFYDYLQNVYSDNYNTFDRTDSFILTKEIVCDNMPRESSLVFMTIQVCNTFWLFLLKVTDQDEWGKATDYTIDLLATWKNYSKERRLICVNLIELRWFSHYVYTYSKGLHRYLYDDYKILKNVDSIIKQIDLNNFKVYRCINSHVIRYGGFDNIIEKHIPLLKSCGVAGMIKPLDIFLAFDEYFSLEKQSSERTSSVNITDKEKIVNHGFDVKDSFRGKHRKIGGAI